MICPLCSSALKWICTYLRGRSQCIFTKQTTSAYRQTNKVPQGSVLSPLLFFLYNNINDLKCCPNTYYFRILYADEPQVYVLVLADKIMKGIEAFPFAASKVMKWAEQNRLQVKQRQFSLICRICTVSILKSLQSP